MHDNQFIADNGFKILETRSDRWVADELRNIGLLQEPIHRPYREASIRMMQVDPDDLAPPSFYVLKETISALRMVEACFNDCNRSLFQLYGDFAWVRYTFRGAEYTVTAPIIERSRELVEFVQDGSKTPTELDINIIADGMHRLYLARDRKWESCVWCIVPPDGTAVRPYYAFPSNWNRVKCCDVRPAETKKHRIPNYKSLYRDLSKLGSVRRDTR